MDTKHQVLEMIHFLVRWMQFGPLCQTHAQKIGQDPAPRKYAPNFRKPLGAKKMDLSPVFSVYGLIRLTR
jgi:hypothetical protein